MAPVTLPRATVRVHEAGWAPSARTRMVSGRWGVITIKEEVRRWRRRDGSRKEGGRGKSGREEKGEGEMKGKPCSHLGEKSYSFFSPNYFTVPGTPPPV